MKDRNNPKWVVYRKKSDVNACVKSWGEGVDKQEVGGYRKQP